MKYMRRTAGYTWTDYKTNAQIAKELKITQILNKLLEYKRNWIQHVNRMPRYRLPRVMKHYCPTGRRNHGRTLKILLDTWDWNGSTSGPTPWKTYDDDDDDVRFYIHALRHRLLLPACQLMLVSIVCSPVVTADDKTGDITRADFACLLLLLVGVTDSSVATRRLKTSVVSRSVL